MSKIIFPLFASIFLNLAFAQKNPISFVTYNLGLAENYIPMIPERLEKIPQALVALDADVLCLQEVWDRPHQELLMEKLKESHPYSMRSFPTQKYTEDTGICRPWDLIGGKDKFLTCMVKNCSGLEGDARTDCLLGKCGAALTTLKNERRECAEALFAQVGKSTLAALWEVFNPFRRAGLMAYEGSDGLMIFSRYPLENTQVVSFADVSTITRRGALIAFTTIKGKKVQVGCTHLAADLSSSVPYAGKNRSFQEESREQARRLLKFFPHSPTPLLQVLMGDFNCGFGSVSPSLKEESAATCQELNSAQFTNLFWQEQRATSPHCSFCISSLSGHANSLNRNLKEKDSLIDHILYRDNAPALGEVVEPEIRFVLDQPQVLSNGQTSHLSDHYGLILTFFAP